MAIINFFPDHAAIYFNIIERSISIVQYEDNKKQKPRMSQINVRTAELF